VENALSNVQATAKVSAKGGVSWTTPCRLVSKLNALVSMKYSCLTKNSSNLTETTTPIDDEGEVQIVRSMVRRKMAQV